MNKSQSSKLRARHNAGPKRRPQEPPAFSSNVVVTRKYRFRSTDATSQDISRSDLIGIAGAVCSVANTSLNFIAGTVKLHSVEVWSPVSAVGSTATVTLLWASTGYNPRKEVSDTTLSVSRSAHVFARPPQGSAASFWGGPSTDTVFSLEAPVGSIIDVSVTHVLSDTGAAGSSYGVAVGTLGALYYLPLDGATDVYVPVGLNTTS